MLLPFATAYLEYRYCASTPTPALTRRSFPPLYPHRCRLRTMQNLMVSPHASATDSTLSVASAVSESAVTAAQEFAPVLNIPALLSFVFIVVVFGALQIRVAAMSRTIDQRTDALDKLRSVKSRELQGDASSEEVQNALEEYKKKVEEVETLRTIIPGVARLVPPPSGELSRERMNENIAAARQFLGIDLEPSVSESSSSNNNDDTSKSSSAETKKIPIPLAILLMAVAASQIGLLLLLLQDPMSSSMQL